MPLTKLAGGHLLSCGHNQVIAAYRLVKTAMGMVQPPVYCIECEDWSELPPHSATMEEAEAAARIEKMIDPYASALTNQVEEEDMASEESSE